MDKPEPTGRPPAGHAFRAEQARQALGITSRPAPAEVPISRFILPLAALHSLCLVLDGDDDRLAGVVAVALAATTIAVVPRLDARRRLRCGGPAWQLVRQFLGIVVVAPMLVAAATPSLSAAARIGIVAAGVTAVGIDSLHAEGTVGWRAVLAAGLAAAVVAGLALLPGAASAEVRAGALLIVWYGARSLAATLVNGRFSRVTLAEYSIVAVAAGMALQWTSAR